MKEKDTMQTEYKGVVKPSPAQSHQWVFEGIGWFLVIAGLVGVIFVRVEPSHTYAGITVVVGIANVLISRYRRRHP